MNRLAIRVAAGLAASVVAALVLVGCSSSDGLAANYASGDGYVSGDGQYTELKPADRKAPVSFSGPTVDGGTFSSDSLKGKIAVINFWYAGCPPCRLEAPSLAKLSTQLTDVQFVGVNVFDNAAVAKTFDDENDIAYPSILDVQSGSVQLAFAGGVPPNAVPTTIVLDAQGRVAARISGLVEDPSILQSMIETVQEEG